MEDLVGGSKGVIGLSDHATKLKLLLQQDDLRRRQQAIREHSGSILHSSYDIPTVSDIAPLVDNQASVEHQLQEQVNFYQDALVKLKEKSDEIASENAKLYERMRKNVMQEKSPFSDSSDTENESDYAPLKQPKERLLKTKAECDAEKQRQKMLKNLKGESDVVKDHDYYRKMLSEEMEKMENIYETKSKHLDTLLKSSRMQIEKQQEEITSLKSEIRLFKTPVKEGSDEIHCSKCSEKQKRSSNDKKIIDRLSREKDELVESLQKQQKMVAEGSHREMEAYHQVKRSCELVEQTQLEKQEALVQVKQLKKDLEEYKERHQHLQKDIQEKNTIFNKKIKTDMEKTINDLNKKVEEDSNIVSGLEVQLEKLLREKVEFKKELEQLKDHITSQKLETTAMVEESRKEVMEALKKKMLVEQENHQIQLDSRMREKRKQQKVEQLTIEVQETKRRLQMTEETLHKTQSDMLDVTNKLNSCQQQLQYEKLQRNMLTQSFEDEKKRIQCEGEQRGQELSLLLHETDARYNSTKEELTRLLDSQTELVNKYQEEYKILTMNISLERKKHQENASQLSKKLKEVERKLIESNANDHRKDTVMANYKHQIENNEIELKDYKEQVIVLLNKQNTILRDRHLLSKEIDLLRSQLQSTK